jgi:hypothetical protein
MAPVLCRVFGSLLGFQVFGGYLVFGPLLSSEILDFMAFMEFCGKIKSFRRFI